MSVETIRHQAEAFVEWAARVKLARVEAWRRWIASKDFGPADTAAIAREVQLLGVERAFETFLGRHTA